MSEQDAGLKSEESQKRNALKDAKPRAHEKIVAFEERVRHRQSIAILQFQYDYHCNFACQHCSIKRFQGKKEGRAFTPADVRELSRQADAMGLAHFVLTGGEPLIFPDFDQVVEAMDPSKFYVTSDTNGWMLTLEKARHLKAIGVDKIQISLDSLSPAEHDEFRKAPHSHERVMRGIDAALEAGLAIIVQTVVPKARVRSEEFLRFVETLNAKGVGVFVTFAKPVGAWEGNYSALISREDMDYVRELGTKHDVFTHLTPGYGLDLGCIAVKRMVSITKYGDVLPCPYLHVSLGNFFEEPLAAIIERGLKNKWFGQYVDTCLVAEDRAFIEKYVAKTYGKPLPIKYEEMFSDEDLIREPDAPEQEPTGQGPVRWPGKGGRG